VTATVVLWRALVRQEKDRLAAISRAHARSGADVLPRAVEGRMQSLANVAGRQGAALREPRAWSIELVALKAVLWVEPSGEVGWVLPREGRHPLTSFRFPAEGALLSQARRTGRPGMARSGEPGTDDSRFDVAVPVHAGGALAGYLVGVFSSRDLCSAVFSETVPGWALAVTEGGCEVYRRGEPPQSGWVAEARVPTPDVDRRVHVAPLPAVAAELGSLLPEVVLLSGSAIGLLLGASVGLAQSAHRRAGAAQAALRVSGQQLRAVLDSTMAAVHVKDAEGRYLLANRRTEELLARGTETVVGCLDGDLLPPETAGLVRAADRTVLTTGAPSQMEETLLLDDGPHTFLSVKHREFPGDILASSRHLLQLVGDLLDLAKAEAGRMDVHAEPARAERIVEQVTDTMRPLAAQKGIHLSTEVDPLLGEVVVDAGKLRQALYNFLSNAVKFTPAGGRVAVRVRSEDERSFRVEVQDTRIGIAADDAARLFTRFLQVDGGMSKRYAGTGLGLALTRELVELQGGHVGVDSALGQGSTFFAVLPRVVESAAAGAATVRSTRGVHGG
jgi:signal transduction histidine kinase